MYRLPLSEKVVWHTPPGSLPMDPAADALFKLAIISQVLMPVTSFSELVTRLK